MYANRVFLAAAVLTLAACGSENTTAPSDRTPVGRIAPSAPSLLHGIVVLEHRLGVPTLQTESGIIRMQGDEANAMASVDGADVVVAGTLDGPGTALLVASFEVVGMHGRPAVDGFLEVYDDDAYAIRLASGGVHWVTEPPKALSASVGKRIWLTERMGNTPAEFGRIRKAN